MLRQDLLAVALVFLLPSSMDEDGSTSEKRSDTERRKQLRLLLLAIESFIHIVVSMDLLICEISDFNRKFNGQVISTLNFEILGSRRIIDGHCYGSSIWIWRFACAFLLSPVTKLMVGTFQKLSGIVY